MSAMQPLKSTTFKGWGTPLETAGPSAVSRGCSLGVFCSVGTGVYRYYEKTEEVFYCDSYIRQILASLLSC